MNHLQNIKSLFSKNHVEHPLIETTEIGEIHIVTGKLVACDPLLTNDMQPFDIQFPLGNFSVQIHQEKESGKIAYTEIVFGTEKISKWKLATTKNQKIELLKEGEIYGYPVESEMACFMDWETQNLLNELEQELYIKKGDSFSGIYKEFFSNYFEDNNGNTKQFAILYPKNKKNNIIAFESGFGKGFYASYIGLDKINNPVKIVTEFIEILD